MEGIKEIRVTFEDGLICKYIGNGLKVFQRDILDKDVIVIDSDNSQTPTIENHVVTTKTNKNEHVTPIISPLQQILTKENKDRISTIFSFAKQFLPDIDDTNNTTDNTKNYTKKTIFQTPKQEECHRCKLDNSEEETFLYPPGSYKCNGYVCLGKCPDHNNTK